jgi:hypothetical protein
MPAPVARQNAGKALTMDCLICRELERAFDMVRREYSEARSSAYYPISGEFAAVKNVDMERARYELEEHRLLCVFAGRIITLPAKPDMRWRRPAA